MNDEEFGFLRLLKLKYGGGDQTIRVFFRIRSSQEIKALSLIWGNFR